MKNASVSTLRKTSLGICAVFFLLASSFVFFIPSSFAAVPNSITKMNNDLIAGYVINVPNPGAKMTIQGSWVVPTLTCSPSYFTDTYYAVEIDLSIVAVEKLATEANCLSGTTTPTYDAFVVTQGGIRTLSNPVSPGDKMKATIAVTFAIKPGGSSTVKFTLKDLTKSWTFSKTNHDFSVTPTDAAWILNQINDLYFPQFTTLKTSGDTLSTGSHSGSLGSFKSISSDPITENTLTDYFTPSDVLAYPSSLSSSGSSFTINWNAFS